jgi:hypothetical protein
MKPSATSPRGPRVTPGSTSAWGRGVSEFAAGAFCAAVVAVWPKASGVDYRLTHFVSGASLNQSKEFNASSLPLSRPLLSFLPIQQATALLGTLDGKSSPAPCQLPPGGHISRPHVVAGPRSVLPILSSTTPPFATPRRPTMPSNGSAALKLVVLEPPIARPTPPAGPARSR